MMKYVRKNAVLGRMMLLPVALASGFAATAARADDDGKRFYVDPMASYTLRDKYRGTDDGIGGQISVGKRLTKGLDLELIGTYTDYKSKDIPANNGKSDATLYGAGLGTNVYLAPSAESFLKGFYIHLDVLRGQGFHSPGAISDYTTTIFDGGLGYKLRLTDKKFGPFAPGIAIRAEALYRHDAHGRGELGESTADNQHQYFQEATFNIGLHFPLGGRQEPVPAAEPEVQVVPVEEALPAPAPEPPPCLPPAPGQPISLEGCKTGDTIVLRGVNFEFDKAKLTVNAKTLLDQVADALLARPDIKVEVDGHTDGKGSGPYNLKLSDRRAASVVQYLIGKGIDAGRMTSKGFGKTMPIATNDTDEGRELNRRVELKIVGDGSGVTVAPADGSAPPPPAADAAPPADGSAPAADSSSAPSSDSAPSAPSDSSAPSSDSTAPK
jgi:OOP family OmpA-OmpF porin